MTRVISPAVENFVGKILPNVNPQNSRPNLFILFLESLLGKEVGRPVCASRARARGARNLVAENHVADVLSAAYPWIKALHLVAAVAGWRGFSTCRGSSSITPSGRARVRRISETFKVMERRLLRLIMNPAMIATWVLGLPCWR